jgi:hypothetical protein
MQHAIPGCGFYAINVHDLNMSFSLVLGGQREKLWWEFFLDPSQWWDHRPKKVIEHQSYQSSYVNAAIALLGVNLVAICCYLAWSKLGRNYFQVLCTNVIVF